MIGSNDGAYGRINRFVLFLKMLNGSSNYVIQQLVLRFSAGEFDICDRKALYDFMKEAEADWKEGSKSACAFPVVVRAGINAALEKCLECEETLRKTNATYCTRFDDVYPWRIKNCEYLSVGGGRKVSDIMPVVLYLKGDAAVLDHSVRSCAVIGTRKCSGHAFEVGRKVSGLAASKGYSVVGGLALGCDTAGHEGCLRAKGRTIAVVATGIDRTYPPQNEDLAERIVASGGLLVSEQFPGTPASAFSFVSRDRIQAMLSDKIVVLQTSSGRGAMHAAKDAHCFGKKIYALDPKTFGPYDDASGNSELIERYGAVEFSADDTSRIFDD